MVLSSFRFIIFFAVIYLLLSATNLIRKQNKKLAGKLYQWILLIGSYLFLGYTNYKYCVYVLCLTGIVCWVVRRISRSSAAKRYMILGVAACIAGLAVCKYGNFFVETINNWFGLSMPLLKIAAPLGVSFYTFSAISYIVDVYRREYPANDSLPETALYLVYFPKLVSGPLIGAGAFFERLRNHDGIRLKNLERGIQLFMIGLFKKIVLADHLGVFVDDVYRAPSAFSSLSIWLAVISYAFQLYFDFSGYSDMAIGLSEILGIRLERNFNLPYVSKNLTEFWKRWHISLSSWLQKYLYFPLGGNRKGVIRTYINLFLVMAIGGIWHGAGWTFLLWGCLHGLGLVVHKIYRKSALAAKNTGTAGKIGSCFLTFAYVSFCWIFFRASSADNALDIIQGLFCFQKGIVQIYSWTLFALAVYVTYLVYLVLQNRKRGTATLNIEFPVLKLSTVKGLILFFVFCGLTICMAYFGNTAFIYGKF